MTEKRPAILALYPSLPSMTKAAGDKTSFKFVETLHRLKHRIVLLSFAFNGRHDENDYRALEPLCEKIALHDFGTREKLGNMLKSWFISPTLAARGKSSGMARLIDENIGSADMVHIEFTELLPWARYVKKRYPGKRVCYVAHDVVFQKKYREARQQFFLNPWRDLDFLLTWISENRYLACVDTVIVQNEKDAALLPRHAARMSVVVPYAETPQVGKGADGGLPERYLVYFGAMARPENYLAATSFIQRCWPALRREFPDLWLYVVGARPPERLKILHGTDNVVVTGFVEDAYSYLKGALLTVAPITLGAGIKVKVLESLMVGTPVLAFPAGAEGINLSPEDGLTVVRNYPEMTREIRSFLSGGGTVSRSQIQAAVDRAFNWSITEKFLAENYR